MRSKDVKSVEEAWAGSPAGVGQGRFSWGEAGRVSERHGGRGELGALQDWAGQFLLGRGKRGRDVRSLGETWQ